MRTQGKTMKTSQARENAGDQVEIGFCFAYDWLRELHEFSGPITERSKEKLMQTLITFDNQLKTALKRKITNKPKIK